MARKRSAVAETKPGLDDIIRAIAKREVDCIAIIVDVALRMWERYPEQSRGARWASACAALGEMRSQVVVAEWLGLERAQRIYEYALDAARNERIAATLDTR